VKEAEKNKSEGKPYSFPIAENGIDVMNISKDDVIDMLNSQNIIQAQIMDEIKRVVAEYRVPLTQNTRNGHCLNMSIVGGGNAKVAVNEGKMVMSFERSLQKPSSDVSNASMAREDSHLFIS
jgi:predicted ATP-dependent protease